MAELKTGARRAEPRHGPVRVPAPSAGVVGVQVAEIVAINATTFSCRWHDADGLPTGDAFTVYIVSLPVVGGLIGQQDPADCDPRRVVGDLLRVEYRTQYIGGGQYLNGWWAVPEFTLFECEAECI